MMNCSGLVLIVELSWPKYTLVFFSGCIGVGDVEYQVMVKFCEVLLGK
jgi:hypothetical protein